MATAVMGYAIVCVAIALFLCRLEWRQHRLQRQHDALAQAADKHHVSERAARGTSRAA
jgi:hypothetical protein